MIRKTQRHTETLASPIPMTLEICEMTLRLITESICSGERQSMCRPKPVRTNLVSQATPMIAAIWTTPSEAPRKADFVEIWTDQAGYYGVII